MPEGDRDFISWLTKIEAIVRAVEVPIIVKEVDFGMSQEALEEPTSTGIQAVDVNDQGGTSFTQIKDAWWKKRELSFLDDWGQSAVISLLESQNWQKKLTMLGSGGVRNFLDIVKGPTSGAESMGVARTISTSLMGKNGLENTLTLVQQWQKEVKMLYTPLGKKTTGKLTSTALILDPVSANWYHNHGIDSTVFAKR